MTDAPPLPACPACGSNNTHIRFYKKLKAGNYRPRMKCEECGKPYIAGPEYDLMLEDPIHELPNSVIEHRADGSVMVNKLLALTEEDEKDPKRVLVKAGFDPDQWKILRCRLNAWNGQRAHDRGQLINRQVKLDIAPRTSSEIDLGDVEKLFSNLDGGSSKVKVKRPSIAKDAYVLEVCLADLHIGNGTIDIEARADHVTDHVIKMVGKQKISKILLVFLGDTLTFDTFYQTTTRGTPQTGKLDHAYEMFDRGAQVCIKQIDKLAQVAPVEVIPIYGNHDKVMSYALFKGLEWWYRDTKGVTFDTEHADVKHRHFGKCQVLWDHGDKAKAQLQNQIFQEARAEYGSSLFSEIHSAHIHQEKVDEPGNGIKIRRISTVTNPDEWHILKGYKGSLRSSQSFLWDPEKGIALIINSNL